MTALVREQIARSLETIRLTSEDRALHDAVVRAAEITADAMRQGKLLVCGNGGSAADSQHLVAEFVSRLVVDRPALPAIALTTDSSILTAIGNDFSYENVFERQVEALGRSGDVLLAISTSGNSRNCLRALRLARKKGIRTIALVGNGGGEMAEIAEVNIIVPSSVTMNIQEAQLMLEHIFCMTVEKFYFGSDFGVKGQQLAE